MCNNFAELVCNHSDQDKIAVIHDSGSVTYRELGQLVKQFAYQLTDKNILPGDRVVMLMSDRIEWVIAFLGCMYAGVVPAIVSPKVLPKKYQQAIEITRARAIITDIEDKLTVDKNIIILTPNDVTQKSKQLDNAHKFLPDEIGMFIPSSGTTGRQKFIAHRHENFITYIDTASSAMKLDQSSVVHGTSTLNHVAGTNITITIGLGVGSTVVLSGKTVIPNCLYKSLVKHNVTHFHSHPGVYAMMAAVKKSLPIPSLRFAGCFSQQYPEKIALEWEKIYGTRPQNGYGLTETFSLTMLQSFDEDKSPQEDGKHDTSLGQPVSGTECEIRDEQGQLCENNVVGELYVSSSTSGSYYLNDWAMTKHTFVGKWVKTNDLVYRDNNNNIHYVSRKDDVVKINGYLVSMNEVQKAIEQHPDIEDCVVQRTTNKHGLDKLSAQIVMKKDRSADTIAIRRFLLTELDSTKVPKYIDVVKDLPIELVDEIAKTISGKKIIRKERGDSNDVRN